MIQPKMAKYDLAIINIFFALVLLILLEATLFYYTIVTENFLILIALLSFMPLFFGVFKSLIELAIFRKNAYFLLSEPYRIANVKLFFPPRITVEKGGVKATIIWTEWASCKEPRFTAKLSHPLVFFAGDEGPIGESSRLPQISKPDYVTYYETIFIKDTNWLNVSWVDLKKAKTKNENPLDYVFELIYQIEESSNYYYDSIRYFENDEEFLDYRKIHFCIRCDEEFDKLPVESQCSCNSSVHRLAAILLDTHRRSPQLEIILTFSILIWVGLGLLYLVLFDLSLWVFMMTFLPLGLLFLYLAFKIDDVFIIQNMNNHKKVKKEFVAKQMKTILNNG